MRRSFLCLLCGLAACGGSESAPPQSVATKQRDAVTYPPYAGPPLTVELERSADRPPRLTLHLVLEAPDPGHDLALGPIEGEGGGTRVSLFLVTPGPDELNATVITRVEKRFELGAVTLPLRVRVAERVRGAPAREPAYRLLRSFAR